jgi:hypothetical protein
MAGYWLGWGRVIVMVRARVMARAGPRAKSRFSLIVSGRAIIWVCFTMIVGVVWLGLASGAAKVRIRVVVVVNSLSKWGLLSQTRAASPCDRPWPSGVRTESGIMSYVIG